jgi:drug/metabolite transporter (DMT)-like permease
MATEHRTAATDDGSVAAASARRQERVVVGLAFLAIAFTAYNWLLERYSPTLVATHTYVNPVVAVVLGWWLADEQVTMRAGVAAAMVVGAVVLVDRGVGQLDREAGRLP